MIRVAYRHSLRIEPHDEPRYEYTDTSKNPFGIRGIDYDPNAEYKCEPLYLKVQNATTNSQTES